ncbi:unnamed protein product, partial [Adineta steineri]
MALRFPFHYPTSRIVTISNLTPSLFDQLHREHGETLSCPCSTITIPYNTFVTNNVSFHPVCSSVFVSKEWIEGFYLPVANAYLLDDFRTTAFSQFDLLAALCSISNDIVSKALLDIQNNQLVTVELFEEEDIQLQVKAMVELVNATAYVQVTTFLQLVQMMYRSNTLVSAFGTNAVVHIGFYAVYITSTYYVDPNNNGPIGAYALSCTEKIMVTPAVFYAQPLDTNVVDHTDWPIYYITGSAYTDISASVDGFFGGCFPLDSVLASTLDCSILCLLLFNSLKSQTITIIEKNPSLTKYNQLQILYPDTLTCPCANTTMPYETFVSLSPVFHQLCSSDLISESWILLLSNSGPEDVVGSSWISKAAQYFGLLSRICQLANLTATDNIRDFFARTFVTSYVLIETDFNIQVNATVKQLTESIVISFNLFNIMTRLFIQADQPIIVSQYPQVVLNYINTTAGTNNSQALQFAFRFNTITKNQLEKIICHCDIDPSCQGPISFAIVTTIGRVPLPGIHFGTLSSDYVAPGLVNACYTIDFVLLSTLQCFYTDSDCMNHLFYYINKTYSSAGNDSNLYAHPLIYNQTSTRFPPNTSVSSIVEEMMIEQWNTSLSFSDYYEACAPTYCTYTQIKHTETFSELLVTLISTVGGLVMALRLITFQLVKIIFGLFQKKTEETTTSIIFVILTLYTLIQPQTLTKSFAAPSLNFYQNLMNEHSDELECPCSLISSPYDEYLQIQPIFHQICSSDLISNEWRLNITANIISNLSAYNQRDYRLFLSTHLQFLNGLCQLSMQTVNQSIQQSLSSLMITKQLLSEENFNLHINSMINEAKSNAPSTFIRLLSLLQATNHGNAIVSSYGTNYQYLASVYSIFSTTLYTQAMIYDNNCSCQLNSTCIINASFIDMNSTQTITIKGLKMGCTPSESLLASTLECFYDQSCINLIQTMTGYNKNITPIPLNITNSRFLMNMTVMNLINDLFVEKWSTIMNYSSYFYKCSPMICSYTYIQQLNSFYTLTYFLGLYGGLTIVLKWISPKIVYFINKIYQRRKKTTNSIKPISTIESETIEIMDANNINNTSASSQSLQTVSTHSKKLFSISSNYWIFGLLGFILVTIGILIPCIYVLQEKKNHSTST